MAARTKNFKVVLLGEGCVGKTSLVLRYCEDKFNDKHITTLQASFLNKKLNVGGKKVNLSIWSPNGKTAFRSVLSKSTINYMATDQAGQERFHALGPIYYRDSNGAILVYDITDEDSFQKVKNWVKELRKMLGQDICLCIAGNKIDLEKNRHVSIEEAEEYAKSVGAKHVHTSAKLNKGIDDVFLTLTKRMLQVSENHDEGKSSGDGSTSRQSASNRRGVVVVSDDAADLSEKKAGCCS